MTYSFFAVSFSDVVELLKVIIWPLTLLIIVFKFKTFFGSALNRMQSLDASATGISMTFQEKIEEAKTLLNKSKGALQNRAKMSVSESNDSAYKRVLDIKASLLDFLSEKARSKGIKPEKYNPKSLSTHLAEIGLFTLQQQKAINTVFDLANSATPSITKDQAQIVEDLYDSIK